jgi:hypothetical protein
MSGDKVCFRRLAKVLSPQITLQKRIGVQIAYSQSDTFAEGVQIKQILLSPKICGFAICGFAICGTYLQTVILCFQEIGVRNQLPLLPLG